MNIKKKQVVILIGIVLPFLLCVFYRNELRVYNWLRDAPPIGSVIHNGKGSPYASYEEWIDAGEKIPCIEDILIRSIQKKATRRDCYLQIDALAGLHSSHSIPYMLELLNNNKILISNKESIISLMGALDARQAIPVIYKIVSNIDHWEIQKNDESAHLLVCSIMVLSNFGDKDSIPLIQEKLKLFEDGGILLREYQKRLQLRKGIIINALDKIEQINAEVLCAKDTNSPVADSLMDAKK